MRRQLRQEHFRKREQHIPNVSDRFLFEHTFSPQSTCFPFPLLWNVYLCMKAHLRFYSSMKPFNLPTFYTPSIPLITHVLAFIWEYNYLYTWSKHIWFHISKCMVSLKETTFQSVQKFSSFYMQILCQIPS